MILLDAGASFGDIQLATGFRVSGLAGCLISHGHGDHVASVKHLLKAGVNCYASEETWRPRGTGHHREKTVEGDLILGQFKVTPFEAVHDLPGTLGFVVTHETDRALYLTDSAYSRYTFDGLTHIFVEANHSQSLMNANARGGEILNERYVRTARTHMSIERLVGMLKANDLSKVREIWLLHLSDQNSDEVEFKTLIERATGCPVLVAPKRTAKLSSLKGAGCSL